MNIYSTIENIALTGECTIHTTSRTVNGEGDVILFTKHAEVTSLSSAMISTLKGSQFNGVFNLNEKHGDALNLLQRSWVSTPALCKELGLNLDVFSYLDTAKLVEQIVNACRSYVQASEACA